VSIRLLLADDQELVRTGFRLILNAEPDMVVAGEASDGTQAVDESVRLRPDVVLMDVRMPGVNGIEATRRLGRMAPEPPRVIMLTTFDLDQYVYEALRAGASGFLLKDAPAAQLVDAIRVVAAGDALLAPTITRRMIAEFAKRPVPHDEPALAELTSRELEVLTLIARGRSNAEIGKELFISDATVKTHVKRVLAKLGLRDRVQAVVLAYETGLIQPGDRPAVESSRVQPGPG
jgi:DNA-binding NarL/FixJ family response regulator